MTVAEAPAQQAGSRVGGVTRPFTGAAPGREPGSGARGKLPQVTQPGVPELDWSPGSLRSAISPPFVFYSYPSLRVRLDVSPQLVLHP